MFDIEKVDKAIEHIADSIRTMDIKIHPAQCAEVTNALAKLISASIEADYIKLRTMSNVMGHKTRKRSEGTEA